MLLQQVGMRTLHFLIERGYFEVPQLPRIMTALFEFDGESPDMVNFLARSIANIMGVPKDDPLPEALALFVKDFEVYLDSAERFFDTDEAERLATDAFAGSFRLAGSGGEYLRANMHIPNEPYITNGEWDEEGILKWRKSLPRVDTTSYDLPVLIYAFWSDPDRDFQNEHFGREVLFEESLGDYCYWRNHLTKKQGKQWDSFVASLDPDEKLLERLTNFQFKGEPDRLEGISYNKDVKSGIALAVIVDILEELKKARESSPE
jgi:hypothetical protein